MCISVEASPVRIPISSQCGAAINMSSFSLVLQERRYRCCCQPNVSLVEKKQLSGSWRTGISAPPSPINVAVEDLKS